MYVSIISYFHIKDISPLKSLKKWKMENCGFGVKKSICRVRSSKPNILGINSITDIGR